MPLLLLFLLLISTPVWAVTTLYVSTGGSGDCSSGSPCSLDTAKGLAAPGDTITLGNGTYSGTTTINCNSGSQNGTSLNRITLKATNERQAHLAGGGEPGLQIYNCQFWTIEGLHISNVDNPDTADCCAGAPIYTESSQNNIYRRLLVHHNNRWNNSHGIEFYLSDNNLIEENELYDFHRHGIMISQGSGNIIRRNYVNSRGFSDLQDCTGATGTREPGTPRCSNNGERGDAGIQIYPGSNTTVENNVSEGQQYGFELISRYGAGTANKWFGNLANNNQYGFSLTAGCDNPSGQDMPTDSVLQDNVAITNEHRGFRVRSPKNAQYHHNSVFGSLDEGAYYADLDAGCPGDGEPTSYVDNFLATHTSSVSAYGINVSDQTDWSANYLNIYNYTSNSPSLGDSHVTNATTTDPQMGACYAWIPDASPMKGAGLAGTDLGANVLYRYQDGALSSTPLWDTSTGDFTCGVVVAGVNDNDANNCRGIPARFHINQGGCSFPAGYGTGAPPPVLAENCNRLENPLVSGWGGAIDPDHTIAMKANGTVCTMASAGTASAYWSVPLGANRQISADCPVCTGSGGNTVALYPTIFQPSSSAQTVDGYRCTWAAAASQVSIQKITNGGSGVNLGVSPLTHTTVSGDKLRCQHIGTTISLWQDSGSGWTEIMSVVDTSFPSTTAYVGMHSTSVNFSLDNITGQVANVTRWAVASGGSSTGDCTDQGAACTLTRALAMGGPGDTVILRDGIYNEPFITAQSGEPNALITIQAEHKHGAVIQVSGGNITDIAHNYLVIRGIRFDGQGTAGVNGGIRIGHCGNGDYGTAGCVAPDVHHVTFEHNLVENVGYSGVHITANQNNLILRHNIIRNTGMVAYWGECFYLGSKTDAIDTFRLHDVEIYGNELDTCTENGVDVKEYADTLNIHHNIIHGQRPGVESGATDVGDPLTDKRGYKSQGSIEITGENIDVHDNIMYANKPGWGALVIVPSSDVHAYANVAYNELQPNDSAFPNTSQIRGADFSFEHTPAGVDSTVTGNTFCAMTTYAVDGATGLTVSSNPGIPGGVAQSVCDAEVSRIMSELPNLAGFVYEETATPFGVLAKYPFLEGSGLTVADFTGNNHTGTFAPDGGWTTGRIGPYAGLFDGTRYVTVPGVAELRPTVHATLSGWFKATSTSVAGGNIVDLPNGAMSLYLTTSGHLVCQAFDGTNYPSISSGATYFDDAWRFADCSYEQGDGLYLRVNHTQVGFAGLSIVLNYMGYLGSGGTENLEIGRSSQAYTLGFIGSIDQVTVKDEFCDSACDLALYQEGISQRRIMVMGTR